jgi:hypothetical protein
VGKRRSGRRTKNEKREDRGMRCRFSCDRGASEKHEASGKVRKREKVEGRKRKREDVHSRRRGVGIRGAYCFLR